MNTKIIRLIILFCFPIVLSFAQGVIINNLKKAYQVENTKTEQLKALINLSNNSDAMHIDTFIIYSNKIKELIAPEQNIGKNALADSYLGTGILKKGFADSAKTICENALQGLNYNNEYKNSYTRIKRLEALIAIRMQEYQKALEIYFPLLNDAQAKKDTFYINVNTSSIGYVYMEMAQTKEAIKWFKKSLDYKYFGETKKYIGKIYSNIAAVYNEIDLNDSAEKYILLGLKLNEEFEQYSALANSYAIYSDILTDTKRILQAELPMLKAIEIRKQIGDPFFIVSDMAQLGIYYANNNQTDKGIAICKEGIKLCQHYNINAKLPFLYNTLAQNYKAANNKDAYSATLEKIIQLKDSIYAINSAKAIAESNAKYEAVNQQLQITQSKNAYRKKTIYLICSITALLLTTLLMMFFLRKKRKK